MSTKKEWDKRDYQGLIFVLLSIIMTCAFTIYYMNADRAKIQGSNAECHQELDELSTILPLYKEL